MRRLILTLAVAALAAACSRSGETSPPQAPVQTAATPAPAPPRALDVPTPAPLAVPPVDPPPAFEAPTDPQAVVVNTTSWPGKAAKGVDPALVRAQVLLARAHFSPGAIDGRNGENLRAAVRAYEAAHQLPVDGKLDTQVWDALTKADGAPAVTSYTITDADVAGPFTPPIPKDDYRAMSKLDQLGYVTPLEALAERFRMDEALLKALNPQADFAMAGARILVAAVRDQPLPAAVAQVEVDKSARQVRAFDAQGQLLAAYPATVGSTERPAPSGVFKVTGVARDPDYTYDPKRLTFGDRSMGKLTIKPGPNNPVGVVWINLNVPSYGIHGAPDPQLVGKVASHGCVRLTNWDARELADAVKAGVKVTFTGEERGPAPAASRPKRS
jgi:lipoprotein-anchoring transpeptidase ErfK/SrfK